LKEGVDRFMSRSKLLIMCASVLFMLGLLLTPGLFSVTARADSTTIDCSQDPHGGPGPSTVQQGDKGKDVKLLQESLNWWLLHGYNFTHAQMPLVKDGKFGPKTEAAVRDFQSGHRDPDGDPLAVDGIVGPKTWAVLGHCKVIHHI
jgi:peptidoglycan hydrolase-like protein with peptidoglycan-binding domain